MLLGLLLAVVLVLLGLYLSARARQPADATASAPGDAPGDAPTADPGPAPAAADDPPFPSPIDLSALNRLRAVDQDGAEHDDRAHVLPALIDAFRRSGPDQLEALHAALAQDDPIPALTTLGLFRTSARLLGARDLEALAGRLQPAIEARDTAAAATILQAMRAEFDLVSGALRDFAAAA